MTTTNTDITELAQSCIRFGRVAGHVTRRRNDPTRNCRRRTFPRACSHAASRPDGATSALFVNSGHASPAAAADAAAATAVCTGGREIVSGTVESKGTGPPTF